MRPRTVFGMVALAATLTAASASAEFSDAVVKELQGYVDACMQEGDTVAKRAGLLTWGYIAGDDEVEKIADYKSADDASLRLAAGLALWRAGQDGAKSYTVEQLKKRTPLYPVLRTEITALPDDREAELLRALVDNGKVLHKKAVFRYLAHQHGPLYNVLGDYVASSDEKTRNLALQAVRSTARKKALDFVESKMLPSSNETIQVQGVKLAIHVSRFPGRTARAVEVLEGAVDHSNATVVEKAAVQLLKLHDNSGVQPLVDLIEDADELSRRKSLARKLLEFDVTPPDDVKSLYKEAALAMKKGSKKGTSPEVDAELTHLYLELSAATGDDQVFKKLRHMFGTTKFEKRLSAARAFGRTDKTTAVDMLKKALFEGSKEMRLAAARSLRQIGDKSALPALKRSISQERSQKVKIQVIRALGAIGTPDALRILRFNSRDRNPEVRKAIVAAVRDTGAEEGFETLRLYLNSRDLELQWKAFLAVLDIAPKKAMKRLDQVFRNPPDGFVRDLERLSPARQKRIYPELLVHETRRVRLEVFDSARRLGSPMYETFRNIAFEKDSPDDVRKKSLRTLSELKASKDRDAFEKLARNADSLELRELGAWTLAEYGSSELEATFRGFVTSDSPMFKGLGAYGLVRIQAQAEESGKTG